MRHFSPKNMLFFQIIAKLFSQAEAGRLHPRHLCRARPQPRHSGWWRGGGHQGGQQQVSSRLNPRVPRRRQAGCEGWLRVWWAMCGQLSPTSATCPPCPCRCPRTQQRLPRLQQHTGDALEILYTLYYPRCLAFIHWYIFLYLRLHTFAVMQEGSAQAAVHRLSEDQEEECKCFLGAVKVVQPSPGREM